MSGARPRVLMPVFNPIDYDGRVQRAAEAVATEYDVTVLSVDAGGTFRDPRYQVKTVVVPRSKVGRHLAFLRALLAEARRLRPAVVHAHDFFMATPGWLAARSVGAKLVYDAHELMIPEEERPQTRHERFWYLTERAVVRRADLLIAANPERAAEMRRHYGLKRDPLPIRNITPAPSANGAGLSAEYPALTAGGPDAVRLIYQGDMSMERGIGNYVSAMSRLPAHFHLILAGGGPDLEALKTLAATEGVAGRVHFLGRVPRADLHAVMQAAHIGIITYPNVGMNFRFCAPNKLYEYPQAGLPMLGSDNPVLRNAFGAHAVGVVSTDPAEGALKLAADLPRYRAALPAFVAAHRWEDEAARLLAAYRALLSKYESTGYEVRK
ncbi:MAG TPA: glycosyltransferase [Longimicrobium sp.]|nr:glycosyltransferase [Longimicrobium sp.]